MGFVVDLFTANKQASAAKSAANTQAQAATQASDAQLQASREANATQLQMYNQSRSDAEPWRQAGQVGLNEYMSLLGLQMPQAQPQPVAQANPFGGQQGIAAGEQYGNPFEGRQTGGRLPAYKMQQMGMDDGMDGDMLGQFGNFRGMNTGRIGGVASQPVAFQPQQAAQPQMPQAPTLSPEQTQQNAFAKFRANPGYQFGLDEGMKSVQASAAARGGLNSGAALKSLFKYGNDYADQQGFTPYMNRIASLSNIGQTQNAQNAALGQGYANAFGQNTIGGANAAANGLNNAAAARAQGIYGSANAWSNGINNAWGSINRGIGAFFGAG